MMVEKIMKMELHNKFIVMLFCLMGCISLCTAEATCEPIDVCSCRMSDSKKVVSLWDIDDNTSPKFKDQVQLYKETYFVDYSPCTPFNEGTGTDSCVDEIVCQHDQKKTTIRSLGRANAYSMSNTAADGLQFIYNGGSQAGLARSTKITLKCDETQEVPEMTKPEEDAGESSSTYKFTLTTKCACPGVCQAKDEASRGGLSTGSILVILFFVFVIVYFIGGFVFLKFYKKSEGSDAIPQFEFWKDFPAKVKDGVKFTIEKATRKNGEYEQI